MSASEKLPALAASLLLAVPASFAADPYASPSAPALTLTVSNGQKRVTFTPYPGADVFQMRSTTNLNAPFTADTAGVFSNLTWTAPGGTNAFHALAVTPLGSNALLTATVLSKITYGPTPELLDRLAVIGPDAYIAEQLAPETILERAAQAHTNIALLASRFGTPTNYIVGSAQTNFGPGTGEIRELQSWLVLNAVFADRQLLEVLTQFWENHFVTYFAKSANFFVGNARYSGAFPTRAASEWEWREVTNWRNAMMRTNWTFHDLLRISAESCAMIQYLDTATSRADGAFIPNENYSREILELFTMGVDNGYDQSDITNMAPAWAGWRFTLVTADNAYNPHAPPSMVRIDPAGNSTFTNTLGVWAFNYRPTVHGPGAKRIFGGKLVPARFGAPYTTKLYGANSTPGLYELNIPARTGTNGIQDGYDIVAHLASLPFTQEYISVKLCRLFVHDDFQIGYDFANPAGLTAEGQLVKACMDAWEAGGGQMRPVLKTIFDSALFRGHGGNAHKVKTPLEYCVSAIRALRLSTNGTGSHGSWSATTDGYGLISSPGTAQSAGNASPLMRMGSMSLFNRESPDGYPESAGGWVDAGSLGERIRFISSLLKAAGQTNKNDANGALTNNITHPVRLLQVRLPGAADQLDAGKVADVFLGLIYPGEGRAALDAYRNVCINFLNRSDDDSAASPFTNLTVSSAANSPYDNRVRGMVALLMSLQRFQEQ